MKKLIVIALVLVGTTIIAQEGKRKQQRNEMEQFTPDQKSQLILKRMTLELDLTDVQQKEMSVFISDKIAKMASHKAEMKTNREKGVKPTNDERFAMHMKMLDEQIAAKKSIQKILNAKQFEKWTSLKEDYKEKHQRKHQNQRQG